jgi:coenzyme F420-reducing hydrogenase beta subunit
MVKKNKEAGNAGEPKVYAAWSLNDEIRINSTSGGIFSELAIHILNNGGYICGARYGRNHHIEHCITNTIDGLEAIRQSKYAQSDKGYIYREIKQLLLCGQKVLFCGTPCECSGLRNYLQKDYDNLIVVDFICRGANSPRVYEKFLEYLENEYESKCVKVWFKNKTYGWNRFSTKIEFASGDTYLEDRDHDPYILGYIKYNLYMRPSCAKCRFRTVGRLSDITLADFWGVRLSDPSLDTEKGTSMVLINSPKGADMFGNIKPGIFHEEKSLKDVLTGNPCLLSSPRMNKKRDHFFRNLETESFKNLMKECCRENILDRFKSITRKLIR